MDPHISRLEGLTITASAKTTGRRHTIHHHTSTAAVSATATATVSAVATAVPSSSNSSINNSDHSAGVGIKFIAGGGITNETVHFNVGGRSYQVARSLLQMEQFANTLLARMMSSDVWINQHKNGNNDPNSAIFLGVDGERFRYILDYMRHGRVSLPMTESKTALLRDMAYLGFDRIDLNAIDDCSMHIQLAARMSLLEKKHSQQVAEYDKEMEKLTEERNCVILAYKLFKRYSTHGSLSIDLPQNENLKWENEDILNKCLAQYGLEIKDLRSWTESSVGYELKLLQHR